MTYKTNFHLHTHEDPKDRPIADYTIYEALDRAEELGFEIMSLTCHNKFIWQEEYARYARQKNILLIPGIELSIKKKHVVILNLPIGQAGCGKEAEKIKSFEDLRNYKKNNPQIFIIAPHPFVWDPQSLGKKLLKNINLFDAIELSIFSNKIFNFNKKARQAAEKYNKPLVAASDTHYLDTLEKGYCLINAEEKTPEAIFDAIKNGRLKNKVNGLNVWEMLKYRVKGILKLISNQLLPT